MYELIKKDGLAKRGRLHTVHGVIETPVFMNVGTAAAIKGAVATSDLQEIKTQVELSNTYHLHVRPGDEVVKKLGGLHKFMNWDKPILTDSKAYILIRILMEEKSSWDRKRVCRYSQTLHLRSLWHLMNVHPALQTGIIWKSP